MKNITDMPKDIPTLYPVPFDGGGGPTQACRKIAEAMYDLGIATPLFVLRRKTTDTAVDFITSLPTWSRKLPRRQTLAFGRKRLERIYLTRTKPEDLCVLWPGTSPELMRALKARGNVVVLETTNTPMRVAKRVLDAAYARVDTPYSHKITAERISEEEALFAMADGIFCPSPLVEDGLREIGVQSRILSTSRGTLPRATPAPDRSTRAANAPLTCLYVGTGSVRKGLDRLLELWPKLPDRFHLHIVGRPDAVICEQFGDYLAHPRVTASGFAKDVTPHYDNADIFILPSLEEGDPKVTYEAASAGLPLVVSRAGGGRLLQDTDACMEIDPNAPDTIAHALITLAENPMQRLTLGLNAQRAAAGYSWAKIAERRHATLMDAFPHHVPTLVA